MGLTTRTLPQLFNGVSRQPAILRSIDQTEAELNSWAAASSGVGKRPPTETVAKIADSVSPGAFIHIINRDVGERYVAVIDAGVIKIVGFDGVPRTVNTPNGTDYLSSPDLKAVTVADYTFIVNRNKKANMKDVGADTAPLPDYVRDPTRQPTIDGDGTVRLPGGPGGYQPNTAYL